jgi:creatinine amidohydrolase
MADTSTESPEWGRYTELLPTDFARILAASPIAFVPWGALEWHGPHLPLGSEGFIAEAVAERVAARNGGIVLPTTWWPVAPIPQRFSIGIRAEILQELWDGLFGELARIGFRMVVLLSGHFGFGHDLVLMDAAEHAMARHHVLVLAIPPLALVDEQMLDHAGHWETALIQALRPRLVALEQLDHVGSGIHESGVIGENPHTATAGQGESALRLATERITLAIRALHERGGEEIVRELYTRRRELYAEYVQQYFRGSWEDAIDDWWRENAHGNAK